MITTAELATIIQQANGEPTNLITRDIYAKAQELKIKPVHWDGEDSWYDDDSDEICLAFLDKS